MRGNETTGIAHILSGVPHTKLQTFKEYFEERIKQNLSKLENETDVELYRAQGASRELKKIILDLDYIIKS